MPRFGAEERRSFGFGERRLLPSRLHGATPEATSDRARPLGADAGGTLTAPRAVPRYIPFDSRPRCPARARSSPQPTGSIPAARHHPPSLPSTQPHASSGLSAHALAPVAV